MEKSANADDDEQSPKVKAEGLKKKVKTVIVKAEPVKVEQIKEKVSVKEEMAGHIEEGSNIEVLESEPSDSKVSVLYGISFPPGSVLVWSAPRGRSQDMYCPPCSHTICLVPFHHKIR